jgi:hypothetical protein
MAFSLKFRFNKKINVDEAGLRALDEQFKDLSEKIEAGDYVVTVEEKPVSQNPKSKFKNNASRFEVVIKPADNNRAVEAMTFECTDKTWMSTDQVYCTWFDFKIKTRDNQTFVGSVGHEPGKPEVPEYMFLNVIAKTGRTKIAQAKGAAQQRANAAIKNTVKL